MLQELLYKWTGNIIVGGSAEQAHLEANDRIITGLMAKNSTWDDIRPSYKAQQTMVTVVAEREGQTIETTVIPKWNKIVLRLHLS